MMHLREFHNGLRLLRSIDASELGDPEWWPQFRNDPYGFLVRCAEDDAEKIWAVMVKRGAVMSPPIWEDIAVAICCGEHCSAANHAPDHGMDTEHYCERYGCHSTENYKSANAVLALLSSGRVP